MHGNWHGLRKAAMAVMAAMTALACGAQQATNTPTASDVGITSNSILLGATFPLSGPAAAYADIAKSMNAYFQYVNDNGGVNGRKVVFTVVDDGYDPSKTPLKARELVEQDKIFAAVGNLGTGPNLAVRQYYNDNKVPDLFVFTGSNHWGGDFAQYPWTIGWQPDYQAEGKIYAKDIVGSNPSAKIAILYQNDDYGKDYVKGITDGLGDKAKTMIVSKASYEVTDPTVDSQIVTLKASGADVFFNITTPKFGAQAVRKVYDSGWKPLHIINNVAASVGAVLTPAGLDKSEGLITIEYYKDPTDAQWKDDPAMKDWLAFMAKYYPDGKLEDASNTYGYRAGQVLVQVMTQCGRNLERGRALEEDGNGRTREEARVRA